MNLTRRALLAGTSVTVLALAMPIHGEKHLDQEALKELADRIYTGMKKWPSHSRHFLFAYGTQQTTREIEAEWLDKDRVVDATHRALKLSFRRLEKESYADGHHYSIMLNGKLTLYGQHVVMGLPLAPSDREPHIFPLLNRLAPHYLS